MDIATLNFSIDEIISSIRIAYTDLVNHFVPCMEKSQCRIAPSIIFGKNFSVIEGFDQRNRKCRVCIEYTTGNIYVQSIFPCLSQHVNWCDEYLSKQYYIDRLISLLHNVFLN